MKYVCTVCGYVYDDAEQAIPFEELPDSWQCPICGAPKALFKKQESGAAEKSEAAPEKKISPTVEKPEAPAIENDALTMLNPGELSALFSNLAKSCEKQYQEEAKNCFQKLADYFEAAAPDETDIDIKRLSDLIAEDLDGNYQSLRTAAVEAGDRGALRIIVWGEKVSRMAKSLIDRYLKEGGAFLENTGLYVCTVCGFLYVGDEPPAICPVCKVAGWKFKKIEGRTEK